MTKNHGEQQKFMIRNENSRIIVAHNGIFERVGHVK